MNIPLLCFLSFLTGAGSCAAFSASLKICTYGHSFYRCDYTDHLSRPQLATSSWNSNRLPAVRFWSERILLHYPLRLRIPRQYLWIPPLVVSWQLLSGIYTIDLHPDITPYDAVFRFTYQRGPATIPFTA